MNDDANKLRARIAILEAELAGAAGAMLAIAEHFEQESGMDDQLVRYLHERAAEYRKWARVTPSGAQ